MTDRISRPLGLIGSPTRTALAKEGESPLELWESRAIPPSTTAACGAGRLPAPQAASFFDIIALVSSPHSPLSNEAEKQTILTSLVSRAPDDVGPEPG